MFLIRLLFHLRFQCLCEGNLGRCQKAGVGALLLGVSDTIMRCNFFSRALQRCGSVGLQVDYPKLFPSY